MKLAEVVKSCVVSVGMCYLLLPAEEQFGKTIEIVFLVLRLVSGRELLATAHALLIHWFFGFEEDFI